MADSPRSLSRSTVINASPETVFDLLADPRAHPRFDGSGTVAGRVAGPARLGPGSSFGMVMRIGLPYLIRNTVVEYDENRLLAWQHFGHHRWRYELEPVQGGTKVTETFDWSTSRWPWLLEAGRVPAINAGSIKKTLARLKELVEGTGTD